MIEQRNTIIQGDALEVLKTLPDGIVQTCVTSPPYYGLRDYGIEGQIGLEETPDKYISRLVEVFREVKRVLRDDGTLWINIGDSYAGSWGNYAPGGIKGVQRSRTEEGERWERKAYQDTAFLPPTARVKGLKPKDLIGVPWMLAFALRADGWYLRSDIIWAKSNCMPESVTDRPTKAHEYIFLLSKSERYYYDAQAIAEPSSTEPHSHGRSKLATQFYSIRSAASDAAFREPDRAWGVSGTRNRRSVWTVPTVAYSESHFATFPPKLIEPCILAGTSPRACEHCGAPWERVTEATGHINKREPAHAPNNCPTKIDSTGWVPTKRATDTWQPTCSHTNEGTAQCIVLDPFIGAGTVALVSTCHSRSYIGIELNPEYVKMARKRIATIQPDLWSAAEVMSIVRERVAEATPEEADELLDKLDALIEEKGGVA